MTECYKKLINTNTLARVTGTSKSTWEKMRLEGRGPRYIKVRNLVWYRWSDIEVWLAAHEILTGEIV
jgi:predicted DNA-binding transcriptional regulator AlpA